MAENNDKRIRRLTETMWGREPFIYELGQVRKLPIDGKPQQRIVCDISETTIEVNGNPTDYFVISIANGEVSQEWINIPKSDRIKIEYVI